MTSENPHMILSAACAMACNPEAQKRLTVTAEALAGTPARSEAIRATFIPCSASGIAQPRMTSSTSFGSSPGTRLSASPIASAARSSGRVARSAPLYDLTTGVRHADAITTSLIAVLLVPQWLARLQQVLDALLSFSFPAEADKGFALQVKQVLFADRLWRIQRAAGEDVRQLLGNNTFVVG